MLGAPFIIVSYTPANLLRTEGFATASMTGTILGAIVNMILDPLLVLGVGPFPRLEVVGAAVATVTAQIIVLLILVAEILRDHGEANVLHKIRLLSRPDIACLKRCLSHWNPHLHFREGLYLYHLHDTHPNWFPDSGRSDCRTACRRTD